MNSQVTDNISQMSKSQKWLRVLLVLFVAQLQVFLLINESVAGAAKRGPVIAQLVETRSSRFPKNYINEFCWQLPNYFLDCEGFDYPIPPSAFGVNAGKKILQMTPSLGCVAFDDGAVMCQGKNDYAQIGDGTVRDSSEFQNVKLPVLSGDGRAKRLLESSNGRTRCLLRHDGTAVCWGLNDFVSQYYPRQELIKNGKALINPTVLNPKIFGLTRLNDLANNSADVWCAAGQDNKVACLGYEGLVEISTSVIPSSDQISRLIIEDVNIYSTEVRPCVITLSGELYCKGDFWPGYPHFSLGESQVWV